MCGRYQSWIEDDELAAIIERERRGNAARFLRRQEVFPGEDIPVLYGGHYFLRAKVVRWGYPMEEKRQTRTVALTLAGALADPDERAEAETPAKTTLVINARAETVLEKRFFRENFSRGDMLERRVAIPTSGYYEWRTCEDGSRQKYHIGTTEPLYIAAMTHVFGENAETADERAVILTTAPLPAIRTIHDRMPLLLTKAELEPWLYDDRFSREKLMRGCVDQSLLLTAV